MAIPHAQPGEVIDVRPLGEALSRTVTHALVKTDRVEVSRVVLAAGRVMPEHRVAGEVTALCLEGRAAFTAAGATRELAAGRMLYLAGGEQHSLRGTEDSSLLVTILPPPNGPPDTGRPRPQRRRRAGGRLRPGRRSRTLGRRRPPPPRSAGPA